jgi:hypothetical protein
VDADGSRIERCIHRDYMAPQLATGEHQDLLDDIVDVEVAFVRLVAPEYLSDARDRLAGAEAVAHHGVQGLRGPGDVRGRLRQPAQTGPAVVDDRRQGLVDLVGDGRADYVHRHQPPLPLPAPRHDREREPRIDRRHLRQQDHEQDCRGRDGQDARCVPVDREAPVDDDQQDRIQQACPRHQKQPQVEQRAAAHPQERNGGRTDQHHRGRDQIVEDGIDVDLVQHLGRQHVGMDGHEPGQPDHEAQDAEDAAEDGVARRAAGHLVRGGAVPEQRIGDDRRRKSEMPEREKPAVGARPAPQQSRWGEHARRSQGVRDNDQAREEIAGRERQQRRPAQNGKLRQQQRRRDRVGEGDHRRDDGGKGIDAGQLHVREGKGGEEQGEQTQARDQSEPLLPPRRRTRGDGRSLLVRDVGHGVRTLGSAA